MRMEKISSPKVQKKLDMYVKEKRTPAPTSHHTQQSTELNHNPKYKI